MTTARTTQFDTIHDWMPTHNYNPEDVIIAKDEMQNAWEVYQNLCDMAECGFASQDELQIALLDAQIADDSYASIYNAWQQEGGMSR